MSLSHLNDQSLHAQLMQIVKSERALLTQVLDHLREVERRRLYCDFKRSSLFDYAVSELGYSEDQAHRRIQAMRLIKSVPEAAEKLASGALSLTNASRAQGLFRKASQSSVAQPMNKSEKLAVLEMIEHKSTRDAEKELLKLQPKDVLPTDRQRTLSEEHTELKVVVDQQTLAKLEEVRSLLGVNGALMSHAELLVAMADLSIAKLQAERFGKRRSSLSSEKNEHSLGAHKADQQQSSQNARNISRAVKHEVWHRDGGQCSICKSKRNVQFDHLQPVALGGSSTVENLRLLCFACNQRAAIRVFGVGKFDQFARAF